jgi:hypothetical protein
VGRRWIDTAEIGGFVHAVCVFKYMFMCSLAAAAADTYFSKIPSRCAAFKAGMTSVKLGMYVGTWETTFSDSSRAVVSRKGENVIFLLFQRIFEF